jgi:hypothetical protein
VAYDLNGIGDSFVRWNVWGMTSETGINSVSCWACAESFGALHSNELFRHTNSANTDGWGLHFGSDGTIKARIITYGSNSGDNAVGISTGEWFHILAVFDQANTTLALYINAIQKYLNTSYGDTSGIVTGTGRIFVGSNPSYEAFWDGRLAEFCYLNCHPDAGQRAALAKRFSPLCVFGGGADIVEYYDMIADTRGRRNSAYELTQRNGPYTKVSHIPIIYPTLPQAATRDRRVSRMMHYYRQRRVA